MKDENAKKKTKKSTKDLESEIESLEESLKRALADYQNLERRVLEDRQNSSRFANEELLKRILPSFDNLYLAEKYIKDEGVKITVKNLTENLESVGVKRIDVVGREFDPHIMEAIDIVDGEKDIIIEEVRPGFMLFDKIIRPAQVKVGGGK